MKALVVLLASAWACAAPEYVAVKHPPLAVSSGVDHAEGTFERDVKLYEQSWKPQGKPAKAALVIMHGLKDHSSRYAAFAEQLVADGWAVYAFDLRGHGLSEGRRVYIDDFDEYLSDLDAFIKKVHEREPGKPVFLLGHSMGGAIATLAVLQKKPDLKGLVLSGAALKADVNFLTKGGAKFFGAVAPRLALLDLDLDQFSRDPAVVKACKEDPLVYQGKGPARTASRLLGAIGDIGDHMEEVTLPLLILHGGADKVTDPDGSRELEKRAKSADKTLKIYDGLFHDLLHEPEKQQVMTDIETWLDAHL